MAQAKTIQLLRSTAAYADIATAKSTLEAMSGRKDGELVLARYWQDNEIKSLLGIYHAAPDLSGKNITENETKGWTFIQDQSTVDAILDGLDANTNVTKTGSGSGATYAATDSSMVIVGVMQEDGQVTSVSAAIKDVVLTGYQEGTDADIAATDTLGQALGKLQAQINAMDLTKVGGTDGDVIVAISEADGKVSATKSSLTDVEMTGYSKTSDTGAIAATDTLGQAFNKVENAIAKNTVSSADKTVKITQPTTGDSAGKTDLSVNIDGQTLVKDATEGTISSALKVIKVIPEGTAGTDEVVDANLGTNIQEAYRLVYGNSTTAIGKQINIYKDSALKEVYLGTQSDTVDPSTGKVTKQQSDDPQSLNFVYHLTDNTYSITKVDVSKFLSESEFADGLQVANHVVSVKIDADSEKDSQDTPVDFLSVSSNGIKVSGIKAEIDRKIAALDVTDTAVAGQYVSAVNETDGKVAMTRANVSGAVLNNYAKGTAPASLDIAATDTINQAFAKLEHKIADGVASLDADVTSTSGANVQVQVVETDGKITAVNVTDNSINTTDLNNKIATLDGTAIATAAVGNAYTVLTGVTETDGIISNTGEVTLAPVAKTGAAEDVSVAADKTSGLAAGNVQDTLEALATATTNGLDSVSSGNAAIAVGTKTDKNQSISLVLDTTATTGNITSDMLEINSNGLMMKDTWDCGVF